MRETSCLSSSPSINYVPGCDVEVASDDIKSHIEQQKMEMYFQFSASGVESCLIQVDFIAISANVGGRFIFVTICYPKMPHRSLSRFAHNGTFGEIKLNN